MSRRKRTTKFLIGLIAIIFLSASIAPYLLYRNQERIVLAAVEELNKRQNGHLIYKKSKISPLKQFPYISIEIDSIYFFQDKSNSLDTTSLPIYSIEELYLGFDAWKILGGEFDIKELTIHGGNLNLLTDEDGRINLLLAKSSNQEIERQAGASDNISLNIEKLHLRNFFIDKTNEKLQQHYQFHVKKADLSFNYGQDSIDIALKASMQVGDFEVEKFHFLQNKQLDVQVQGGYGQKSGFITLDPSSIELEGVELNLDGSVATKDSIRLDLALNGQKKNFDILLNFAPNNIQKQAKAFQNEGDIFFIGKIKGPIQYGLPSVDIEFGCEHAWFLNPERSKRIDDLNFRGFFTLGPERSLKTADLKIENLNARPGEGRFQGSFHIQNFLSPKVAANIHAKLDMGEISKLLDIDSSGIKGEIIVDIMLDEFIDPDSLDALSAKLQKGSESKIVFRDFSLETDLFPSKLEQINGAVHLEKGHLVMDSLSVRIDSSDLLLYGKITNFLPFLHWEPDDLIIRLEGKSSKLDLEKLMATQSNASPFSDVLSDLSFGIHFETHTYALWESSFLPEGEFFIDSLFCKLRDFPHELHDFSADILIDSQSVTIKDFHGEVDDSDFNLTAHLQGIEWLNRKDTVAPLLMAIELKSNHLHFQDLMTYKGVQYLPEDYRGEYLSELNIRAEMQTDNQALNSTKMLPDLSLKLEDAHFYLQHHQRKFQNIRASLLFRDGNLEIENVSGNLGASDLMVKGKIQGINDQVSTPKYTIELAAQYLDIDELLDYEINKTNQLHDSAFNVFEKPFANLSLEANVEELVYHKFHFKQLHTRLRTTPDHYIYLDTLHTNGADGSLALNGYFNGSNPSRIYFKSTLQLRDMNIDKIFYKFENFGQDHLLSENLHGYITADVNSRVRMYPDLTPIIEESEAHAEVRINEGSILNYAPLKAMSDYFTDKNLDSVRFGELINTFDLKDGTLYIPNMTISSTLGFLDVSGQQSAKEDLSMDYLLRIPLKMVKKATFNKLFNRQGNNDQEEEIMEDSGKGLRVNVRVTGTPERYDVKMGKRK